MLEKIKKIRKWGVDGGYDFDIEARDMPPPLVYVYIYPIAPRLTHRTSPHSTPF